MVTDNQQNIATNNKRIAKNTLMLYIRMLFMMGVSLFTSRVILQTLGVEDFGIFSVVGGIITMFSFINGGMVNATQRFITFEIGKGNLENLKSVFSTSLQIHALISLLIVILGETVGLWFLYEKMVIPESRMVAALWVYQCSIILCVVNIMSIPYNADIVAHERMSAFAYISIVEVTLKLAIVYLLLISPWDKLIIYSILLLLVQLSIRFIYSYYCNKHFEETKYEHKLNKYLFKEMVSFAGWSFWGNLSVVFYNQGLNLLLNVFFGPIINAARGIAVQVQNAVKQLVLNFQMALNPQITKNYAVGNMDQMFNLMFTSARFSFFLLYLISLPIILEIDFILHIWLGNYPVETSIFTRLVIFISLVYTTANPCCIANQATGYVKKFQVVEGGVLLTIVPISYILLKLGYPPYSVFIVHLIVECIAQCARLYLLNIQINLSIVQFVCKVYLPVAKVVLLSSILPIYLAIHLEYGWMKFILVTTVSLICTAVSVYLLGLSFEERSFINQKVQFWRLKLNRRKNI